MTTPFDPEAFLDGGVTRGQVVGLSKEKLFELANFLGIDVARQISKPDLVAAVAYEVCDEVRKEVEEKEQEKQ